MKLPTLKLPAVRLPPFPPEFWAFGAGLFLFGVGLYLVWPPLAPLGVGLVLMSVSIFGDRKP